MKRSLKLLGVGLVSLFIMGNVSAENIAENLTNVSDGNICIKEDDAFFKDRKPLLQYINGDESIEICDNPNLRLKTSIDSCELEGWYLDKELTQKATGTTIGDILKPIEAKKDANGCVTDYYYLTNLYAKCKEVKQCPVDMDAEKNLMYNNDGVVTKVSALNKQNLLTPTKEGYIFEGWYLDSKFTQKVEGKTTDDIKFTPVYDDNNCLTKYEDVVVYAKWSKIPDTCTEAVDKSVNLIYVIDEKESKKATINVSNNEQLLAVSKDGYKFMGWFNDKELTSKVSDLTFVQKFDENNCLVGYEDITVYAKWEKIEEEKETPKVDNPDTGDNIILYVGAAVILLAGCIVVVKKLTNK